MLILFEPLVGVNEDNALLLKVLVHVRVGRLRVILGLNPCKERALLLWHTETFKGFQNFWRDVIPATHRLLASRKIVADLIEVDRLEIFCRPVSRQWLILESLQRLQVELPDPVQLILNIRDILYRLFCKSITSVEFMVFRKGEVARRLIDADGILGFLVDCIVETHCVCRCEAPRGQLRLF